MKNLLTSLFHLFVWIILMVSVVFVCAWIEYDFDLNPASKSEHLGFYWVIGALVYPLIRFIWRVIRTERSSADTLADTLNEEKEAARLLREENFALEQQAKEEKIRLQQQHYNNVKLALEDSHITQDSLLTELNQTNAKISRIENDIEGISSQLALMNKRHSLLNQITAGDEMMRSYRKKLTKIHSLARNIHVQLVED